MVLLIVIIIALVAFLIFRRTKRLNFGAVTIITGGVKSGKTALSVSFAQSAYRRVLRKYYIRYFFAKLFRKKSLPEKPLLYSNIPLFKIRYSPITFDILMRRVTVPVGSVFLVDEASLLADSQLIKDKDLNTRLLLFFKLFGHYTHGGKCFLNTQALSDLHYSIKRVCSDYYYVDGLRRFPFFSIFKVRQERYSDDGTVVNSYTDDVSKSLMKVWRLNRFYKSYDCYCYSCLTDDKPIYDTTTYIYDRSSLKTDDIISFRPEFQHIKDLDKNA